MAPILVTGSHRSGTTWVGEMLRLSTEVVVAHEPFNPNLYSSWFRHPPRCWFQHVHGGNAAEWEKEVARVVLLRPPAFAIARRGRTPRALFRAVETASRARYGRRHGQRALLKDPIAFFAAEWLADRFGTQNIVLVRHPAAFASSLKRLDWQFDFRNFSCQQQLLATDLARFAAEITTATHRRLDVIDQSILLWRVFASQSLSYRDRHPDWTVIRYEDLAADPVGGFSALYGRLGLSWSSAVRSKIEEATGAANVSEVEGTVRGGLHRHSRKAMWTWLERLTTEEIARVREGTADVASALYSDEDWVGDS